MARKTITREITRTVVKSARIKMVNGKPDVEEIDDTVLFGNVTHEQAQKQLKKEYGEGVQVLEVIPNTEKRKISIEKFYEVSEPYEVDSDDSDEDQE